MCFQDIIPYTADLDIYVPREGANIAADDLFNHVLAGSTLWWDC